MDLPDCHVKILRNKHNFIDKAFNDNFKYLLQVKQRADSARLSSVCCYFPEKILLFGGEFVSTEVDNLSKVKEKKIHNSSVQKKVSEKKEAKKVSKKG